MMRIELLLEASIIIIMLSFPYLISENVYVITIIFIYSILIFSLLHQLYNNILEEEEKILADFVVLSKTDCLSLRYHCQIGNRSSVFCY